MNRRLHIIGISAVTLLALTALAQDIADRNTPESVPARQTPTGASNVERQEGNRNERNDPNPTAT